MLPFLAGSQCVIVAKSGSSSSDDEDRHDANLIVVIGDGQFVDAPVQGVRYVSGAVSGITGPNGEFNYEIGKTIGFYIGDISRFAALFTDVVIQALLTVLA